LCPDNVVYRLAGYPSYGDVIFLPKPGRSNSTKLLTKEILLEIANVTAQIKSLEVGFLGQNFTYDEVCARWKGRCYESAGEKLLGSIDEFFGEDREVLRWPLHPWYTGDQFEEVALPQAIGSPVLDEEDHLLDAGAFKITFFLRSDTELKKQV
jgi:hypothetical protein